jgi:hypothetical protein
VLSLSSTTALRKAGVLSKNFWLKDFLQIFEPPTWIGFVCCSEIDSWLPPQDGFNYDFL